MATQLKKIGSQVIVVTGATSGIGLTTVRMAAAKGAKLVLAARDPAALDQLAGELRAAGGEALAVATDVGSRSDVSAPLQGMYSASKHAVKGFTDSLRMEAEKDGYPLSVTLIKPAGIDTMFIPHARNYMKNEPELPAPLYAPELVADAILFAAEHPRRDIFVGGASKLFSAQGHAMPRMLDKFMDLLMFKQQQKEQPSAPGRTDALYESNGIELKQRQGGHASKTHERSAYTYMTTHGKPLALSLLIGGALLAAWKMSSANSAARGD